ncbi:hypothetical protein Tco_0929133 [Tanacetum coccineum]
MSSIGELTFFLGLQVKQKEDRILISQNKYVGEILNKFGFSSIRITSTPIETNKALTKDEDGEDVDIHLYRCQFGQEIQNTRLLISWFKMLDYGYNFMQTKIHVDNESAISVVKNPVYHSKTKHIEIRHHFIRDSYEKRLIEVVKIHTDNNVADLHTKAFDVSRFNFLVASIRGGDNMERAITPAASLDAAQDSDNIIRNQTMAMPNVDIPQGIDTGGSPRSEDTMGVLLLRLGLRECLNSSLNHLSQKVTHLEVGRVLDLEKEKDVQAVEILRIENRVKRLEKQRKSSTSQPRRRKYRQVESLDGGFFSKATRSEEFHQIVDFLTGSHIS